MRKSLAAIFCLAIAAALFGLAAPAAAQTIELTYANFPPPVTFPCVQMERWADEVEKRTGGKVTIKTFPGGTLLDAKDMFDGVIAGTADIGNLSQAYQPGRFVVSNATALPLGIPNAKVGSQVLWEIYTKYKPEEFAKVKVLTMFATAPSNLMTKDPIRTIEDAKGMSIRASGGANEILQAWGANGVGMPMSATPEALQKGTVKGLFSSLEVLKDFKFAELCKFVTMVETPIYPFAVVMNMEKWNSLPDDVKKVMDDLALEQCIWTGEYMDAHVQESIEWSKKEQGVEIIVPADKEKWDKALEPLVTKWIDENKAKGLPAEEIVKDIREAIVKYSK